MFIAGIDGGGTHTRLEIRDMENRTLRREEFGPFNINSIGEAAFRNLLREVFAACGDMKDCAKICFGAAGISNPRMGEVLKEELNAVGFGGEWLLVGDQAIALRGAMDCPGIIIIAGTGAICFGRNAAGETARSGGYGHLIDDGGSGYCLGRDMLAGAVQALDGRLQGSNVLDAVCRKLNAGPEAIVPFVYNPKTDKAAIAAYASVALELAEQGDVYALDTLQRQARELARMVAAVQTRLGLEGCRIAPLGGLITHDNAYCRTVTERLSALGTVAPAAHDALWGAAQMAWEM